MGGVAAKELHDVLACELVIFRVNECPRITRNMWHFSR